MDCTDVDDCKMRRIVEVVVAVNEQTSVLPAPRSTDIDGRVVDGNIS